MNTRRLLLFACLPLLCIFPARSSSQTGEVYLVLGSDTATWDGMNTNRYHCTYNLSLFTDPARNAYHVMDPAFRAPLVDSYGQPMKLTWWMMAGNIFRFATNTNVPVPNTMTLYLMKKYHGENVLQNGDELSLHYHTFAWTDYDGDGTYWWNQALAFPECRDDFNHTLAQYLLEEDVFPVSFRSGWHYMDNDWQHHLDELLPYSLHNDFPNIRTDTTEPLDNTYNWSESPAEFVPYHPDSGNYQVPGNGPGWNVRSAHFSTTRNRHLMDSIFVAASRGVDQVACLWGHLPEEDFLQNLEIIDSLAHQMASRYPDVKFRYCTAVEAMQRWRKSRDAAAPQVIFSEQVSGDEVFFSVEVDEPIFQRAPFVAVKDIYERYLVVPCEQVGTNAWRTTESFPLSSLAKAGVAVCDAMGNQSTRFINFLPDDIFVDNRDEGFAELAGSWSSSGVSAWGVDSRMAAVAPNDSAAVAWSATVTQAGRYNLFAQVPPVQNPAANVLFTIRHQQQVVGTVRFTRPLPSREWIYLGTFLFNAPGALEMEMKVFGDAQSTSSVAADVVKISALVRERDMHLTPEFIDLGEVSVEDTVTFEITVTNRGTGELKVLDIHSTQHTVSTAIPFPVVIPGMTSRTIPLHYNSSRIGSVPDTLLISSDDPAQAGRAIMINADVQPYFAIVDNEDGAQYQEAGPWHFSVAQAYGPTSRYAYLGQKPAASARFTTTVKKSGIYDVFEIVPTTVNATNHALYEIKVPNAPLDSIYLDQNQGSGNWVYLGRYQLAVGATIEVKVSDTGKSTAGDVLRADAIKIALFEEITDVEEVAAGDRPKDFRLLQNYPNPFNPFTTIEYHIPHAEQVQLAVFDGLGRRVCKLVEGCQPAGRYRITWDGRNDAGVQVASGVYFYRLVAGEFVDRKKMILLW